MTSVRAVSAHEIPERKPLRLRTGEIVEAGRRDTDWPQFVFVTATHGTGWVPARHLSADSGRAIVRTPYDTTELPTAVGDRLAVLERDDDSGWLWCRNEAGRAGWVPIRTVEPID